MVDAHGEIYFSGFAGGVFFPLAGDSVVVTTGSMTSTAFAASASDACCSSSCSCWKNSLQQRNDNSYILELDSQALLKAKYCLRVAAASRTPKNPSDLDH